MDRHLVERRKLNIHIYIYILQFFKDSTPDVHLDFIVFSNNVHIFFLQKIILHFKEDAFLLMVLSSG